MNMEKARFNMIEQQVRTWDVLDDTVLSTMSSISREVFVPEPVISLSYADIEVPIGHGEAMMFPRIEGRMLQELEINVDDNCLEIGTGSGYITACMANMSNHVHSIDIYDDFLASAKKSLAEVNVSNVQLEKKDAFSSWEGGKQYDVIAITGSLPEYLPVFENLLKPDGRLFVVVGTKQVAHAMKVVRKGNNFIRSSLFETELKPLVGKEVKPTFNF